MVEAKARIRTRKYSPRKYFAQHAIATLLMVRSIFTQRFNVQIRGNFAYRGVDRPVCRKTSTIRPSGGDHLSTHGKTSRPTSMSEAIWPSYSESKLAIRVAAAIS